KQKLVRDADEAFEELREALSGLDESAMSRVWLGAWGAREIVIHISGWHREMIPAFGRIGRSQPPYPEGVSYDDFDAWNARFVEARRHAKLNDILTELHASHRDFVAAAAALSEEHFAPKSPARELFEGAGAPHYREHAAQIREWREGGAR
ncbi:MAG TPA: ClbS/DfsB family four-helix bundle protein, partial [Candidatus Methylomirabilis sp.]|nr:ClbS/DfsB family four-helix bundle protein [Candidatus Methylomirabilis sp.]